MFKKIKEAIIFHWKLGKFLKNLDEKSLPRISRIKNWPSPPKD